jgi:hypothetical protein
MSNSQMVDYAGSSAMGGIQDAIANQNREELVRALAKHPSYASWLADSGSDRTEADANEFYVLAMSLTEDAFFWLYGQQAVLPKMLLVALEAEHSARL